MERWESKYLGLIDNVHLLWALQFNRKRWHFLVLHWILQLFQVFLMGFTRHKALLACGHSTMLNTLSLVFQTQRVLKLLK